jgi:pimeloyl-ACP methyl ester carboxylesterase
VSDERAVVTGAITPFDIPTDPAAIDDLRARLALTRWPEPATVPDHVQGIPLDEVQRVAEYWATEYDWPARVRRLSEHPHFRTEIDGLGLHFVHARSPEPDAMPLILTHGWPGSVVEFHKVIGPLIDPRAHGGDRADAFHVVVPSLPGYGFSDRPAVAGWNTRHIARAWAALMAQLGYDSYFAQGGDWGSMVTTNLAAEDEAHVAAIHINMPVVPPNRSDTPTPAEQTALDDIGKYNAYDAGYWKEQSTHPQTLGYGLVDSPVGQLAWILEKLWNWTDHGEHLETVLTRDEVLDNVMLYWLTATGASSARLYWETAQTHSFASINVPIGCTIFPKEVYRTSRRWAAAHYPTLNYWNETNRGGHFAAFEQPELFVEEVRACFRLTR